jgi:hypothetical protein
VPVWTVEIGDGAVRIDAAVVATEHGVLVVIDDEGMVERAYAPGEWRTVRRGDGRESHPAGKRLGAVVDMPAR